MHDRSPHTPPHTLPRMLLMLVAVLALLAAGCSDDGGSEDDPAADTAEDADGATADEAVAEDPPAEEAMTEDAMTEDAAADTAGGAVVATADSDLGTILVDAEGMTLYGFTNDTDGTSACSGDCASTWPPVTVEEGFTVGEGLDASAFTTTERDDGTLQLVVGDWPLYRFQADAGPGDVNGQGVGEVWFVVDPTGQLIQEAAAEKTATESTGDPAYPTYKRP